MSCSYCGDDGHNITTCPSVRRCSLCESPGHNIRTCPSLNDDIAEVYLDFDLVLSTTNNEEGETESVIYDYEKGHFCNVLKVIKKNSNKKIKGFVKFKIGITNDPERRFREAYKNYYKKMLVIYQTNSEKYVRDMERELVDLHWEGCENLRAGGAGPVGYPPYYVYIVVN